MGSADRQLIDTYAETSAISGQICQFSRALLATDDINEALTLAKNVLINTNTSGFLRMCSQQHSKRCFFNQAPKRAFLVTFKKAIKHPHKIYCDGEVLQIKTSRLYLIINIKCLKSYQKDILIDHLAIFVDTLDAWLKLKDHKDAFAQAHIDKNISQANQIEQTTSQLKTITNHLESSYQALVQELLCALTTKFPTMALELDQEELILELIQNECQKHKVAVSKQVNKNKQLLTLLENTVEQLTAQPKLTMECDNSLAVELF